MNKKNNRKGFTIVELVIVIAVIAILATVLVPTFGNVIDKAQASAVEIVIKSYLDCLLQPVDSIEVEVIHWLSIFAHVFVYDGECRRANRVCYAQMLADGCRECGLS